MPAGRPFMNPGPADRHKRRRPLVPFARTRSLTFLISISIHLFLHYNIYSTQPSRGNRHSLTEYADKVPFSVFSFRIWLCNFYHRCLVTRYICCDVPCLIWFNYPFEINAVLINRVGVWLTRVARSEYTAELPQPFSP